MISTRDLSRLPDIGHLKGITQALAMLDAILCPNGRNRYYSFAAQWTDGNSMASMDNGSGDHFFALFTAAGAILKGFAHESPMSSYRVAPPQVWPGILDDVPATFSGFLAEPAFDIEATTCCIWRQRGEAEWQRGAVDFPPGADPDGSADLLAILDGEPQTYWAFAAEYYGRPVSLAAVRAIYQRQPLTRDLIVKLNPDITLKDLAADITHFAYPVADPA